MLPDLLANNLKLVICGTAVGEMSFQQKQYYARPGNRFWSMLYQTGLTPKLLSPLEYKHLLTYGIGLTDLAKNKIGMDSRLSQTDFASDALVNLLKQYQPKYLCFNGKRAAEEFFRQPVEYGLQEFNVSLTRFFVAPSTSGAASKWWNIDIWKELARLCNENKTN